MSGYGFGKKAEPNEPPETVVDFSGLPRRAVQVDPEREALALQRGAALGYVDRGDERAGEGAGPVRRARPKVEQSNLFIKGPKTTLDWFVNLSNERGHKAYWQTLEELRELFEARSGDGK